MLEKKYERKAVLKEKELELRKMELELQQRKWEMEEKERNQRLDLDAEERRAFIELIKKHVNLWITVKQDRLMLTGKMHLYIELYCNMYLH